MLIDVGDVVERAGELSVRLVVAAVVVAAFVLVGRVLAPVVRWRLDRRGRPSYTRVFSGLFRVAVAVVGTLMAITVAFPSVRVADVLAIFGIVSVAAGFAFKDTFENLLAGVLLLLRDPFKSGDHVVIAGREGTIEGVTVRETLLRGDDGRLVYVPNAKVVDDVIDVETDRPALRQRFSVLVAPDSDVRRIRTLLVGALADVATAPDAPAPSASLIDLTPAGAVLECRFWSGSRRSEVAAARHHAIEAVCRALARDGITAPVPQLHVGLVDARDTGPAVG